MACFNCSLPDSYAMDFDEGEFAMVEVLSRIPTQKRHQPFHEARNNLGVIVQLNGHDAEVLRRRIGHDVREIAIQGDENRAEFPRLGDDDRVGRADGKDFPQQRDLMPVAAERFGDFRRHALVAEEAQAHAGTASNSAKSRA